MAINFGYGISLPRTVNMDRNDMSIACGVLRELAELESCIGCGGCTATCTAGGLTEFNFRRVQTLVRRGEYGGAHQEMNKCMLCGKCRLVCPRGIDTRAAVRIIKRELEEH